jgi:hypothetical protein
MKLKIEQKPVEKGVRLVLTKRFEPKVEPKVEPKIGPKTNEFEPTNCVDP